MSVALLINGPSVQNEMVPIATEATYCAVWQSGAKALVPWIRSSQASPAM